MTRRQDEDQPSLTDLKAHYAKHIGVVMPDDLVPPGMEIQWIDQLLFGNAQALEDASRPQQDLGGFLRAATEGHFAYGFWGHGLQSHAFFLRQAESWCRVFLRLPYGGLYSDREADACNLHASLLWLPGFLDDARRRCRRLELIDFMGQSEIQIETVDGRSGFCNLSTHQLADQGKTLKDLLG